MWIVRVETRVLVMAEINLHWQKSNDFFCNAKILTVCDDARFCYGLRDSGFVEFPLCHTDEIE